MTTKTKPETVVSLNKLQAVSRQARRIKKLSRKYPLHNPSVIKTEFLDRLQQKAEQLKLPIQVLIDAGLEAWCQALDDEKCLTFPVRLQTVLPDELRER